MTMKRMTYGVLVFLLLFCLSTACVPIQPITGAEMGGTVPVANELVRDITVAGEPEHFTTPLDATPDGSGEVIYFTALDAAGNGLYQVPAAGGEVTPLIVGAPLMLPQGLAIAGDDSTLYVADAEANQLWAVSIADRGAQTVAGSEGTKPRGVEAVAEADGEAIYFSGVDPADGQPAILKIAASGGEVTVIAKGAPLVDPVGLTVDSGGVIYVADRGADSNGGSVLKIAEGQVSTMTAQLHMGQFPGLALTLDGSALLVSTLATDADSAQVLVTVLATGEQLIVNKIIGANQGAGGLHRAQQQNIFAWADSPNQGHGSVYRVRLP